MGGAQVKTLAVVASVGAYTSIGLTARDTGFLLRTGASGLTEGALLDSNEEPVIMCVVPTLDPTPRRGRGAPCSSRGRRWKRRWPR